MADDTVSASPPQQRIARRRMAYAAVAGILVAIGVAFLLPLTAPNADIVSTGIMTLGAGWITYMGVQATPDILTAFKK